MHNNRMQSEFEQKDENKPVRLNKYLSEAESVPEGKQTGLLRWGRFLWMADLRRQDKKCFQLRR